MSSYQKQSVQTTTTYQKQSVQQQQSHQPQQAQAQGHTHAAGDLNCPCCNITIQGHVNYNQKNYVELQEVKKTSKQRVIPQQLSNRPFVPTANTKYCSIPGCTVCQGMFKVREETDTKVIIHREVAQVHEFQCKFCSFNAADNVLLQMIQEHHLKMAELKLRNQEQLEGHQQKLQQHDYTSMQQFNSQQHDHLENYGSVQQNEQHQFSQQQQQIDAYSVHEDSFERQN